MGALTFLCFFFNIFFLKVNCGLSIVCYLCEGKYWFQCIGYDYTAYMDYMDLAVPKKVVKFNHSLTHLNNNVLLRLKQLWIAYSLLLILFGGNFAQLSLTQIVMSQGIILYNFLRSQ